MVIILEFGLIWKDLAVSFNGMSIDFILNCGVLREMTLKINLFFVDFVVVFSFCLKFYLVHYLNSIIFFVCSFFNSVSISTKPNFI